MALAAVIKDVRRSSGLTLRALARAAGTSHATISAYEHGRVTPTCDVVDRVIDAAGYAADVRLTRRIRSADGLDRGTELEAVLRLAAQFPTSPSAVLDAPRFGHR